MTAEEGYWPANVYDVPLDFYSGQTLEASEVLGDVEPWWCVEAGDGPDEVCLIWTEALAFHVDVRGLPLADEDGDPLPGVAGALETELRRLLDRPGISVEVSDQDGPALDVSVSLDVEPCTLARLADVAWPIVATLTNVFDPGTFGAEYVMGNVARVLEAGADQ